MQTVYLLRNCPKSLQALFKLYKKPDISTNIIIVNSLQAKLLLLDKRVNNFPFIINTSPTNIGLIPKIAKVLPLQYFMNLGNKIKIPNGESSQKSSNCKNYSTESRNLVIPTNNYVLPRPTVPKPVIPKDSIYFPKRNKKIKTKVPSIKKCPTKDGGVDIILN